MTRTIPVLLLMAVLFAGCGATKAATAPTTARVAHTTSTTASPMTTSASTATTSTTAAVVGVLTVVRGQLVRVVRPKSLDLTLNDPSTATNLVWKSWGLTRAVAEGTLDWACCLDKSGADPAAFILEDPVARGDQLLFDKVIVAGRGKGQQPYTETLPAMAPPVTLPPATPEAASTAPATTVPPSIGYGFLATSSSEVTFLQFSEQAVGSLTGSEYDASVSGSPPAESVANRTDSFAGSISGGQVTLNFAGDPAPVFGDLGSSTLGLELPQSDGSLAEVTFTKATPSQYDQALDSLNTFVDQQNAASAAATSAARVATSIAQAQQQAESDIDQDASAVTSDISGVSSDESSLSGDVHAILGDLKSEAGDLATAKSNEKGVVSEAKQYPSGEEGQVCADANQVSVDANQVSVDANQVSDDANQVTDDINTVNNDVDGDNGLEADFGALQSAESALPSYLPAGAPTKQDVSEAVDMANKDIASAIATTNGYINEANAYVTKAFQWAGTALSAGSCGGAPSPPSPQPPITG